MVKKNQSGFSLIELLLVFVVIAVIATLAIPGLLKSKAAAENESAYNTLRTMVLTELNYNASNGRYARLDELNAFYGNGFGTIGGTSIVRGKFTYVMNPTAPTNIELKNAYHISVTKAITGSETPYTLDVDETGKIIEPYNSNHK